MTTEYHDNLENDNNSFWNKGSAPVLLVPDAAKDIPLLKFAVESNTDQLTSVGEALKQLSTLDSISRTVAALKCSLERVINNSSATGGCCPIDWERFGSSCYFFSKTMLSWNGASDWCNGHESHLIILIHDDEWDFVRPRASGVFYWVGLTDGRTGTWEWVNQTPYIMNRRHWSPGQPDSWTEHNLGIGNEDCAHLLSNGRLNDLHCSPGYASSARGTAERLHPHPLDTVC
uniref:LOW QUALITY PROTEIN: C-type lectin domain family 10 member A n=1 Tax=Gasterosteus aculeatus aculeatus TaxID=481459 RepID=UPI001A9A13E6|nr:LOW QUALITY PROTEIN: C-type lectin domain family 10 member A [Gasterosteus aculeatus aculeatus]